MSLAFARQTAGVLSNPLVCLGVVFFSFVLFSRVTSGITSQELGLVSAKTELTGQNQDQIFLSQEDRFVSEPSTLAVEGGCLKPNGPITLAQTQTLASLSGGSDDSGTGKEILEYRVQEGDTLSGVAERFGVSLSTVLWANDLSQNSTISPGQKLTILPVSGVMHLVSKGESVSYLAETYGVESEKISRFNELPEDDKIIMGDLLIIPGGTPPVRPSAPPAPLASSYFIRPIPSPAGITQGLHWYNAVDFSNGACGQPVFSSAGGKVQRTGYHYIAGNYVRIIHPNGIVTFYGHLSKRLVSPGQRVYQGQIIGYVGNTGYTVGATGCHVHFEVRGARNPFAY